MSAQDWAAVVAVALTVIGSFIGAVKWLVKHYLNELKPNSGGTKGIFCREQYTGAGNYVATIAGTTNEIEVTGSGSENAAITIGLPNDVTITNNLNVGGDLNVTGSINTVNSTQVNITDNKINLNSDMPEENSPSLDAGIVVHRGTEADAELLWDEDTDRWQVGLVSGNYHDIARKYVTTVGDGSALTYAITHNLGTREVSVQVYDSATYDTVETDVTRNSTSQVTVGFTAAPAAGAYKVVIVG